MIPEPVKEGAPEARQRLGRWRAACLFALISSLVVLLQWRSGAFSGIITGDAAAHYISGLMARDWLGAGLAGNPIRYLINYHAHLPLTAYGLWPPLFYGVEAVWMLLAGVGRVSILLLSAATTALMGLAAGVVAARVTGRAGGILTALLLVISPVVQRASNELMLDVANALACFLAGLAYAAWLRDGKLKAAVWFGLLASAAMMIKYNALALALLPPLAVLIGRRWDLLRRPAFYLPGVIVAVLCGPWYLATHGLTEAGFQFTWGLTYLRLASVYNAQTVVMGLSPLVCVLAVFALARVMGRGPSREPAAALETACTALALSVFLFLLLVPVALQERYMIPALPPLFVLAAIEAKRWLERFRQPVARGLFVGVVILGAVVPAWQPQSVPRTVMRDAALIANNALPPGNPVLLIVGDGVAEPAAIAEVAMIEPYRPVTWVIRGSRLFGGGGYNNADYQARASSPEALLEEIDRYGVSVVLFRRTGAPGEWSDVAQFEALVKARPDRFEAVGSASGESSARVFRVIGDDARHPDVAALTELSGPHALMMKLR